MPLITEVTPVKLVSLVLLIVLLIILVTKLFVFNEYTVIHIPTI